MKTLILIIASALTVGCVSQSQLTAVGIKDATGNPVGSYKIINAVGTVEAQGNFQNGKMNGLWVFFDSQKVKIAEVTYLDGVPSGPYRTFFGSTANPSVVGKLESQGDMKDGNVVGQHIAYAPDGSIFSNATFDTNGIQNITIGSLEQAKRTADADYRFVKALESIVRRTIE